MYLTQLKCVVRLDDARSWADATFLSITVQTPPPPCLDSYRVAYIEWEYSCIGWRNRTDLNIMFLSVYSFPVLWIEGVCIPSRPFLFLAWIPP